jgi:uncharacterized membrane protein YkvA (DUF1232 family)
VRKRRGIPSDVPSDSDYYERRFWAVVRRHAYNWGRTLLVQILTLYYCMVDPATPRKSKLIIAGALAYTVLPADLVPDLLPMVGWSDDAAMIAWAGYEVVSSVTAAHRERAAARAAALLGTGPELNAE